jgi:hypothetical protein
MSPRRSGAFHDVRDSPDFHSWTSEIVCSDEMSVHSFRPMQNTEPGGAMKISTRLLTVILAIGVPGPHADAQSRVDSSGVGMQMSEANRFFTYKTEPINPRAIQELLPWMSDGLPGPIAIDLEGTVNSNRYYGDVAKENDGSVSIDLSKNGVGEGSFRYLHIGMLANGTHVVETWQSGGGSGVFTSLLFVTFQMEWMFDETGGRRRILTMNTKGSVTLGDRYIGEISVNPSRNTVRIGSDRNPLGNRVGKRPQTLKIE